MNERETIKTLNLSKHLHVLGAKEQHCLDRLANETKPLLLDTIMHPR
jgi:hypothetical protein